MAYSFSFSECFQQHEEQSELAIASEFVEAEQILLVQLMGRLFYKTERDFRRYLTVDLPTLLVANVKKVYIDFQHVSYIDSLGFASLLSLLNQMRQLEITLKFQNLPINIRDLFLVSPLASCIDDQSFLEKGTSLFAGHKKLVELDNGIEIPNSSSTSH